MLLSGHSCAIDLMWVLSVPNAHLRSINDVQVSDLPPNVEIRPMLASKGLRLPTHPLSSAQRGLSCGHVPRKRTQHVLVGDAQGRHWPSLRPLEIESAEDSNCELDCLKGEITDRQ
jgi:hypothetical protein